MSRIQTDILIVGGGIIGCSIAYHLAKAGARDILLVEKNALTHGSTWHAAGVVGQLRSSRALSALAQISVELYPELERMTGQATGWRQTGSLRLASSAARLEELRRSATFAKALGVPAELISPQAARDLLPILNIEGVHGALHVPVDGVADPSMVTNALAAGARQHGVQIRQSVCVSSVQRRGRLVNVVTTNIGEIECRLLVNATGMWAREFGRMMDVELPCCAIEHQYIITNAVPGLTANMPSMRDPDLGVYYKPEANGLIVGAWEPDPVSFDETGIRSSFAQELLPPNLDRIASYLESATTRTPALERAGIREVVNGPIPFSPDGEAILGRIPGLDNVFIAAGCCIGIAAGGGIGRVMADWMLFGAPSFDVWPVDIRRYSEMHANRSYMYPRSYEIYHNHYGLTLGGRQWSSMREMRVGPHYERQLARGAQFTVTAGWEHPAVFMPKNGGAELEAAEAMRNEYAAARDAAGLFDLSHLAKFEILGKGALPALQRMAVSDVDIRCGETIQTLLCNDRGGIEANITLTRLDVDRFYIIGLTSTASRDLDWMRRAIVDCGDCHIVDVTSAWSVSLLTGAKAGQLVDKLLSLEFPVLPSGVSGFGRRSVASTPTRLLRSGFASADGWELHVPTEFSRHVDQVIRDVGSDFGLRDCGSRVLETLRLERGTPLWGSDMTSDTTPFEVGLERCISRTKASFTGRDPLLAAFHRKPPRLLRAFVADESLPLSGAEVLHWNGTPCSIATSSAFSFRYGKPLVYAHVPIGIASTEGFSLESFGQVTGVKALDLKELRANPRLKPDGA